MRIRAPRITAALFLTFIAASVQAQSPDQLYSGGRGAFTDGNWKTAASLFSRLLREYPEDQRSDSSAYMNAVANYNDGEYRKSIEILKSFPKRYSQSVWNRRIAYWKGLAYFALSEWQNAAAEFSKQSKILEEAAYRESSLYYLGNSYEKLEQWDKALKAYEQVLAANRDYDTVAEAVFRMAQINLAAGRAEAAYQEFSRLAYDYPLALIAADSEFWIAESYRIMGRSEDALQGYRNFLETVYTSPVRHQALLEAARLASLLGEDEEALAYLDLRDEERGTGTDPFGHIVKRIRGISYLRSGKIKEARVEFAALLKTKLNAEDEQIIAFNYAQTFIGTSSENQSVKPLLRASKGPDSRISADALYFAATIALNHNMPSASDYLIRFAKEFPKDQRREESLKLAVKSLSDAAESQKALDALSILIRDFPLSSEQDSYLFLRGDIHLAAGRSTEALSDFAAIVQLPQKSALLSETHSRIGLIYAERSEHIRAAEHYMDAAEINGDRLALYSAAVSYFNGGNYKRASEIFSSLAKRISDPWGTEAAFHLGETLYELSRYPAAREAYRSAYKSASQSNFQSSYRNAAKDKNQMGKAELEFNSLYGLAWTWYRESNWIESEKAFLEASEAAANSEDRSRAIYRSGLSQASAERWNEALQSYDRALAAGRGKWREEALYQKAWVLFKLKRDQEASRVSTELVREYPGSLLAADLPFRMGESAYSDADFISAIEWFDRTVQQFPGTEQSQRAELRAALSAGNLKNYRDAAGRYGNWLEKYINKPAAVTALRSWAHILIESGDPGLAEEAMMQIEGITGSREELKAPIILAWTRINGLPEASIPLLESLASNTAAASSDRFEALLLRAHRYRMDADYIRARQIYETLVRDNQDALGAEAQLGLAGILSDEGKSIEAAEAYLEVQFLFPEETAEIKRALREAEGLYREAGMRTEADKIRRQLE